MASWVRAAARAVIAPEALLASTTRTQFHDFIATLRTIPGATALAHVSPAQKLSESTLEALARPAELPSEVTLWVTLAALPGSVITALAAAADASRGDTAAYPASLSTDAVIEHWKADSEGACPMIKVKPLARAHTLSVTIPSSSIAPCLLWLTARTETAWVTREPVLELLNNRSKPTIQDRALRSTALWQRNLTGAGQAVIVGDTGVDHDHCMFYDTEHPTTTHVGPRDSAQPDWTQRKVVWYTTDYGDTADDSGGHGTHVAGTIAGMVQHSNQDLVDALSPYNGHAPGAKLVVIDFKRVGKNELNVPNDLYTGIFEPYTTVVDAGLSSHSWGGDTAYNSFSRDLDRFVVDYPFHLPVFAAGNEGTDGFNTILSPGNAKNALTVGAAVNAQLQKAVTFAAGEFFPSTEITYAAASMGGSVSYKDTPALVLGVPQDGCSDLSYDDSAYLASPYKGAVVVFSRGVCPFSDKALRAHAAGAVSMIVVNDVPGAPTEMGYEGSKPSLGTMSAIMVDQSVGNRIIAYLQQSPTGQGGELALGENADWAVLRAAGPETSSVAVFPHTMASFSSRGPTPDGRVKPDISAAGSGIYSARSDGRVGASSNCFAPNASPSGVLTMSGTSMATPAVAGSMALLRDYFASGSYVTAAVRNTQADAPAVADATPIAAMGRVRSALGAPTDDAAAGSIVPSAAGMKAVAVAAGVNAGGQVSLYVNRQYAVDSVTPAPMSVFQGWGLLNLGYVATFADEYDLPILTGSDPAAVFPANRLYLFDSLGEDVATVQALARQSTPISGLAEWLAKTQVDSQALSLTSLKLVDEKLRELLPAAPAAHIAAPSSHVLATAADSVQCNSSSSASSSGLPLCALTQRCGDAGVSCGLAAHGQHRHCAQVAPLDALTLANALLAAGAGPTVSVTRSTPAGATLPRLSTSMAGFASPNAPYTEDPAVARASLAWTDPAGAVEASKVLVNDLDLMLLASTSTELFIDRDNNVAGYATAGQPDYTTSVSVDYAMYQKHYPLIFQAYNTATVDGAALPTVFTSQLMAVSFAAAGNQQPADAADTSMRLDGVNNVEQAALPLSAIDANPWVLAAAAALRVAVPITAVVRAGALTTAGQHYALAMTGAAPGSVFSSSSSSSSVCGLSDESLFCPHGCSGAGTCVDGQCVCSVPADPVTTPVTGGPDCATAPESLAPHRTSCSAEEQDCPSDALGPILYGPVDMTVDTASWAHLALPSAAVTDAVDMVAAWLSANGTDTAVDPSEVYLGVRVSVASVSGPVQPELTLHYSTAGPVDEATASAATAVAARSQGAALAAAGRLRVLSPTSAIGGIVDDSDVTWIRGDEVGAALFLYLGVRGHCCRAASASVSVLVAHADSALTTTDYLLLLLLLVVAVLLAYLAWRFCCARACGYGRAQGNKVGGAPALEGGATVRGGVVVLPAVELTPVGTSTSTSTSTSINTSAAPQQQQGQRGLGRLAVWRKDKRADRAQYQGFTDDDAYPGSEHVHNLSDAEAEMDRAADTHVIADEEEEGHYDPYVLQVRQGESAPDPFNDTQQL